MAKKFNNPLPTNELMGSAFFAPPPKHRRTKRYSFEFYDDQLVALKKLRFEAEMRGENIPMSEMVREAVDAYLEGK